MSHGLIHHIELNVSNLSVSVQFWDWLLKDLGYEVYQQWELGQSYKLKETYIVFVQAEQQYLKIPFHRKRVGLNHLAFYAKSKEHVDQMTRKLRDLGITILYEDKHPYAGGPEHYAVFFEDPNRIKVELVAPILV